MSLIKSEQEIKIMREGGRILADIFEDLYPRINPGTDVWELETRFIELCNKKGVIPMCKGYDAEGYMPPFPTGLCVSINSQSVHCFPKKGEITKNGDIITVDTVIKHNGFCIDASFAKCVGNCSTEDLLFVETSKQVRDEAIKLVRDGINVGEISHLMQRLAQAAGFDVLREYAGHGIGTEMHEEPDIPCYGDLRDGPILKAGMTICIESLVCQGNPKVMATHGWETRMKDGKNFAQFEHTVLVTKTGSEILTPISV